MPDYAICVTAVSERSDLFVESMERLLRHADLLPTSIVVHEDVRPGSTPGRIEEWLRNSWHNYAHHISSPNCGLGRGMVWCFSQVDTHKTPIVLYTQEDWGVVRPLPIATALDIMERHSLNHIRFNKRKTMAAKHADTDCPWKKVEVVVGGQVLCVSDHWYTQTSLWRVGVALPVLSEAATHAMGSEQFVSVFNHKMNVRHGDGRPWDDQQMRHERLRTYIWGPVGEPRFVEHMGSLRGTGKITNHLATK